MAKVLRLANKAQDTTENLIGGPLKLIDGSWRTVPGDEDTDEVMELVAEGSDSTVIGAVNDVDELLRNSRLYFDDAVNIDSVWLEANATSETAKRSLVYDGEIVQLAQTQKAPLLDGVSNFYTLYLTRHKLWEDVAIDDYSTDNVSGLGGKWVPSVAEGSAEGRIMGLAFQGRAGETSVTKIWAGVRPYYNSTAYFDPVLEIEDGSAFNGANITSIVDSTCGVSPNNTSANNVIQVTSISSGGSTFYAGITLVDIFGGDTEPPSYQGEYMVLCRCKVNTGTVAIHLEHASYTQATDGIVNEPEYISHTNFKMVELGSIKFPRHGMLSETNAFEYEELQIHAEQISDSSTLTIDCLVLIPSKYYIKCTGTVTAYSSGSDLRPTCFFTKEDDSHDCLMGVGLHSTSISQILRQPESTFSNQWKWPSGGGIVVLVTEGSVGQYIGSSVDLYMQVYPRWYNHRE